MEQGCQGDKVGIRRRARSGGSARRPLLERADLGFHFPLRVAKAANLPFPRGPIIGDHHPTGVAVHDAGPVCASRSGHRPGSTGVQAMRGTASRSL